MPNDRTSLASVNQQFNDLTSLNALEERFGLPCSPSIAKAAKALAALHMNIWDVVEGKDIRHPNVHALRTYTRNKKKFFPRNRAKAEGLRVFLIHM
jgi:hypothetical protein